jgi:membrane protein DedA with SNARE-associated domain
MIQQLTDWVQQALEAGGSIALALVMLIENLFPPIPSELVLPYAGFEVSRGNIGFVEALLASTVGSVVGAVILYAIGRYGGRPLVLRWRRVLRVTEAELDRADRWFDRYGPVIVLVARMVPLARSVVSLPAGWSEMPVWRFLALTTLGTAAWNTLLIGGGALLGENYGRLSGIAGAFSDVVLILAIVAGLALGVWVWRRVRRSTVTHSAQRRAPEE